MIKNRDSKGRTLGVQQHQPTTQARPTLTWIRSALKFSAAGTPSYLLIPVPGIPGSQPLAPPQGEGSRHPHTLSSCHSRQSKALPWFGKGRTTSSELLWGPSRDASEAASQHQQLQGDHSHTQLSDRSHLSDPKAELTFPHHQHRET